MASYFMSRILTFRKLILPVISDDGDLLGKHLYLWVECAVFSLISFPHKQQPSAVTAGYNVILSTLGL